MITKIVALFIHEVQQELENLKLAADLVPAAKKVLLDDAEGNEVAAIDKSIISEPLPEDKFGFRGTGI